MKQEALSMFGHTDLILIAFMLFLFSFIGIVFLAMKKSEDEIAYNSNLPLETQESSNELR